MLTAGDGDMTEEKAYLFGLIGTRMETRAIFDLVDTFRITYAVESRPGLGRVA